MAKKNEIATLIKKWRGSRLQKEAAAILGVSVRTFQNWELGVNVPTDFCIECIKEKMKHGS